MIYFAIYLITMAIYIFCTLVLMYTNNNILWKVFDILTIIVVILSVGLFPMMLYL